MVTSGMTNWWRQENSTTALTHCFRCLCPVSYCSNALCSASLQPHTARGGRL